MSGMSLFSSYSPGLPSGARSPWWPGQFPMLQRNLNQILAELFAAAAPSVTLAAQPGAPIGAILTPHIDVTEGDREIRITAELPGMSADDIEITLNDGVLVIRGEKKTEQRDDENDLHVMERVYGTFARYLRLPFAVDPTKVEAVFKDGVPTLVVPKPDSAQRKSNRIEIKRQDAANPGAGQPDNTAASGAPTNMGLTVEAAAAAWRGSLAWLGSSIDYHRIAAVAGSAIHFSERETSSPTGSAPRLPKSLPQQPAPGRARR